jgi:hypothetical protein
VWCGNSHLAKAPSEEWVPMGHMFRELSGIEPFCLDQTVTIVDTDGLVEALRNDLVALGGTAGMLVEELPEPFCGYPVDALLFSVENDLV